MKRNDASGWKRGAGSYSESYPKLADYYEQQASKNISGRVNSATNQDLRSDVGHTGKAAADEDN